MTLFRKRLNGKLSEAVRRQQQTLVPKLLGKGADANLAPGHFGGGPLYLAASDPLKQTDRFGNPDTTTIVRALLESGADPNAPEKDNDTPLIQLLLHGNSEAALLVLGKGADAGARNAGGYTPLYAAAQKGAEDVCRQLLERGADVNAPGLYGRSALVAAAAAGQAATVALLLDKGADIDAGGSYTAVMAATLSGHQAVVDLLAKRGANLAVTDGEGNTVLHHAAKKGWGRAARALLDAGADPTAANGNMNMPADLAEKEFPRVAAMIRDPSAGIDPDAAPASPAPSSQPPAAWTLVGPEEIARVAVKAAVGYRVTEIFNFAARTYTHIASNLQSGAESQSVKAFSELDDGGFVEAAHRELLKQGGTAPYETTAVKKLPAPGGPGA